jgi:hypothetical protein
MFFYTVHLLRAPASENHPAVERGSTPFAATAGSDSNGVSHMLDGITQANILVANKPWKAHVVWFLFAFGFFLRHGVHLLIT